MDQSFDAQVVNGQLIPADVEKDVYVAMPLAQTPVSKPIVVANGVFKPCLILPEDLGDD
jgi:hypothetical protein